MLVEVQSLPFLAPLTISYRGCGHFVMHLQNAFHRLVHVTLLADTLLFKEQTLEVVALKSCQFEDKAGQK